MAEQKNFHYGELWPGQAPKPQRDESGRTEHDPARFLTNKAFLRYIAENGFKLYLDYDTPKIAYTTPSTREIVVNANYPDSMLSTLIQHELGHLMLFDASQFVSVHDQTLRSSIAKILYTPDNIRAYGIRRLLYAENIVEDIIIETVVEGKCVCHSTLEFSGIRAGVKHLDRLESASHIAKEVCGKLLNEPLTDDEKAASYMGLGGHLRSMIQELRSDIEEIDQKLLDVHRDANYLNKRIWRRVSEISKANAQISKLEGKLKRNPSPKTLILKNRLEAKVRVFQSKDRERLDQREAEEERGRALTRLQKKRNLSAELLELLLAELSFVPEGDEDADAESDGRLSSNRTDHLLPDDPDADVSDGGHSFDCGLPHPVTIDRSESLKRQADSSALKRISSGLRTKRLKLQENELNNILSNRVKLPESELSYFKSNKKELDQTDMLKGKKRLRASGINVLVGLDISGSMNTEWTTKFAELSGMVEELQEKLDIENIVYFTYNHRLVEQSTDIGELTLKASGGNAFGFVYQEVMQKLPILQKNEIILVTDCGDNIGFKLSDSCTAERNGVEVRNHISVIDTEEAGFYDTSSIEEDDWSLHRSADSELFDKIRSNIEALIDS